MFAAGPGGSPDVLRWLGPRERRFTATEPVLADVLWVWAKEGAV